MVCAERDRSLPTGKLCHNFSCCGHVLGLRPLLLREEVTGTLEGWGAPEIPPAEVEAGPVFLVGMGEEAERVLSAGFAALRRMRSAKPLCCHRPLPLPRPPLDSQHWRLGCCADLLPLDSEEDRREDSDSPPSCSEAT